MVGVDMRRLLLGLEGLVGVVWGEVDSAVDCRRSGHGVARAGAPAVLVLAVLVLLVVLLVLLVVAGYLAGEVM